MSDAMFAVGLSWRTAPIALRERLAIPEAELSSTVREVARATGATELMLLSTCNRVELYGVAPAGAAPAATAVRHALCAHRGLAHDAFDSAMYEHLAGDAVRHLFRVATALDSLVLGETQILGQLKHAYATAREAGTAGPLLAQCLERAARAAKRVRNETAIARGAANVASVGVELASRVFGDLAGKRVLVIGAGKMSTLAARHLRTAGVAALVVTNRSLARAEELAKTLGATAAPFPQLEDLLATADVVISSTGAREPILTHAMMKRVCKARRWAPMVIVDIAVPRDAEPKLAELDGVYLFDIDDLERVVATNMAERARAADEAARIVEVELVEFDQLRRQREVVPTIRALREHFGGVAAVEADKVIEALRRRAHGPAETEEAIRRLSQLIVAKLLHHPQMALKAAAPEVAHARADAVRVLFALPTEPAAPTSAEVADHAPPAAARGSGKEPA